MRTVWLATVDITERYSNSINGGYNAHQPPLSLLLLVQKETNDRIEAHNSTCKSRLDSLTVNTPRVKIPATRAQGITTLGS